MKRLSKVFLAFLLLTVASASWAACPEGTRNNYKGECVPVAKKLTVVDIETDSAEENVRLAEEVIRQVKEHIREAKEGVREAKLGLSNFVTKSTQTELIRFASDYELNSYFEGLAHAHSRITAAQAQVIKAQRELYQARQKLYVAKCQIYEEDCVVRESEPSVAVAEYAESAPSSITNIQESGVDEGGIVKAHGKHLVVLRRGRLFTVELGGRSLRPVSKIDVSPEVGHRAWYDEMLIHRNTIVVIGYSYQAGATEIGVFEIDSHGHLRHLDTYYLESNDYYSSRNYASRLVDGQLVFYMPYYLRGKVPGLKRHGEDWARIMGGVDVFRPIQPTDNPVLHTVVTCDLEPDFSCHAQGVLGPYGRSFYVSKNAIYLWVHESWGSGATNAKQAPAVVYRFPTRGEDPGAIRVWGGPVDQFSFKEDKGDYLNVLVRAKSGGDMMWAAEFVAGDIGIFRVPASAINQSVPTANSDAYTGLPTPKRSRNAFHNRFVGDYLLYGVGTGWGYAATIGDNVLYAHPYAADTGQTHEIPLPHGIDRIEALGADAIAIGSDGRDLHFSSITLGPQPSVAGVFIQKDASQGETRSHGFFFHPDSPDKGMIGLPIRGGSAPGYEHLKYGSAKVLYLAVDQLQLTRLGSLASDPTTLGNDRCVTSCVDWYGNARPIFYQDRIFALLGYELVEGSIRNNEIREVRRTTVLEFVESKKTKLLKTLKILKNWRRCRKCELDQANLSEAHLSGVDLTGASLRSVILTRADLSFSNLIGANLFQSNLTKANLTGANLSKAILTKANLTGANLSEAILGYAKLYEANLTGANLSGANLTYSNLSEANLTGLNLTNANLTFVNLANADLEKANLTGADLTGADLTNAWLGWARLNQADLTGAKLEGVGGISKAIFCNTTMPDGKIDNSGCD